MVEASLFFEALREAEKEGEERINDSLPEFLF